MQVKKLDCIIKNKQDELEKLKCLTVGGCNYGEEYIQSSPDPHSRENLLIKIIEFRKELENDIARSIELKQEIMNVIYQLNNTELIQILHRRYLDFCRWEQIAVEMQCTYRWIIKLHGRALKEIEKILKSS